MCHLIDERLLNSPILIFMSIYFGFEACLKDTFFFTILIVRTHTWKYDMKDFTKYHSKRVPVCQI